MTTDEPLESVTHGKTTYERWPAREVTLTGADGGTVQLGHYEVSGFSEAYANEAYAGRTIEKWFGIDSDEFRARVQHSLFADHVRAEGDAIIAGKRKGYSNAGWDMGGHTLTVPPPD